MRQHRFWLVLFCVASVFSSCSWREKKLELPPGPDQISGLKKVMSPQGFDRYTQLRPELTAHPEDKNRIIRHYIDDLARMHPNGPEKRYAQPTVKPAAAPVGLDLQTRR